MASAAGTGAASLPLFLLLASTLIAASASPSSAAAEALAPQELLLNFKASLRDPSGALAGWSRSAPYCNWPHVTCTSAAAANAANAAVSVSLSLQGLGLSGELSAASLCRVPGLVALSLASNAFNQTIPLDHPGDVHVLRLPERRRRKPANTNEAGPSEPEFSVLQRPAERTINFRPLRCQQQRSFRMMRYEQGRICNQLEPIPLRLTLCAQAFIPYKRVPPESQGPDLNAPATVEPLLSDANLPFNPATVFAPPYDTVSAFTSAKNLVFCEGNLYQVWRNASCTVTLQLPGGGQRRVSENEILVLRYYPRRQPCWDVVKDLGGYSLFVGRNNAVSMYAEGVPGLRGNCVYWIGGRGRDQGMVFDMESGRSTPCRAPQVGFLPGHPHSTICWYFLSDVVSNNSSCISSGSSTTNGGRKVYQTRARARADLAQDMED